MSTLDTIANNFRFHDKALRAVGYTLKSVSYGEKMKGTPAADKMSKIGSKISWVRQTLRVGSELSILKNLLGLIKEGKSMNPLEWYTEVAESIVGLYFYVVDHWEWATTVGLIKISKSTAAWLDMETNWAWFYSTVMQTIHRLVGLYLNWKALKTAEKKNLSEEDKVKLYKARRTLLFMLFKGFVDFAQIAYYLKLKIAAGPIPSYLFGVLASCMDIFLMLMGGSL